MLNRRDMMKLGAVLGTSSVLPATGRPGRLPGDDDGPPSPPTTPFIQHLPLPPRLSTLSPFQVSPEATAHLGQLGSAASRAKYHQIIQEESMVRFHPELPLTPVWRYRDVRTPESNPLVTGPTYVVRMGEPQVTRHFNRLPRNHVGFGVNHTTVHIHGGHVLPLFDGFPENIPDVPARVVSEPGQHFDYVYAQQDVGFASGRPRPEERPSTMWYHDHLLDFTGPNVMRGLAGMYLVFDELDTGNERTGLRLPSGPFDLPIVLQDKRFRADGTMVYEPGDFNGFLGDKMLVNGVINPFLNVKRRKYRFRILNAANARMFLLSLTDDTGRQRVPFDVIATEGGLMSRPVRNHRELLISMAERFEIVVDFSQFAPGTELYLTDFIEQDSGRGPGGDFEEPDRVDPNEARRLMKFVVQGGQVRDRSRVPNRLRPIPPVPASEIAEAQHFEFEFERTGGAWAINDEFVDLHRPMASTQRNRPQIWHINNGGGGWWHPIHAHIEFMRVLRRNGRRPGVFERDGMVMKDTVNLAGGDEIEAFFNFRDYAGATVFHCHNIEHEDHFMMARFDIEGDPFGPLR